MPPSATRPSMVISAGIDGVHKVWDPSTGELLQALEGTPGLSQCCAASPDRSYVVSVSGGVYRGERNRRSPHEGRTLKLWDPSTGEVLRVSERREGGDFTDCAVAPDGSFIAASGGDGGDGIMLFDPSTGDLIQTRPQCPPGPQLRLPAYNAYASCCAVVPDGSLVVGGGAGELAGRHTGLLCVWDPATGRLLWVAHPSMVHGCAVAPDGSYVVSASDAILRIWDLPSPDELATLGASYWSERAVPRVLEAHTGDIRGCAVAPDGSFVVSCSVDGTLKLWQPSTGEQLRSLEGHTQGVVDCAVAPDGSFVVSCSVDGTVRLWDPSTGELLRTLDHGDQVADCAVV